MIVAYYTTWKNASTVASTIKASTVASTIKDAWVEAIVQDGVNLYVVKQSTNEPTNYGDIYATRNLESASSVE